MTEQGKAIDAPAARLPRLAATLAALTGWRRYALAVCLGVVSAAALPPLYLVPLLWPAFCGLLWLLDGVHRPGSAFGLGWSFGAGHFLAGFYWIGIAFFVDAERFGALAPAAVAGMAAGLALLPALALVAVYWTGWHGPARILALAGAWLAVEWVRSVIFGGFPWNLLGTVWAFSDAMIQFAALAGVWGLSWITVICAAAPSLLGEAGGCATRSRRAVLLVMLSLPALVWCGGALRLAAAPAPGSESVAGVMLRLVQPSIPQMLKWKPGMREKHVADQIDMTLGEGFDKITHVIWAETAVPFYLAHEPQLRDFLRQTVPMQGLLITGAPRTADEGQERRLWNSLHAVGRGGKVVATYDKHRLVPFGEFVPFRSLIGWIKLVPGGIDFSSGPGLETLDLPGLPPFSPLICYEIIFSGRVAAEDQRPQWLLTITNDAWFGVSSGPYQHFASARLRAVEEGLPLVRVANSGISAVVDPYGRVLESLGLNRRGIIDAPLPEVAKSIPLYAVVKDWAALLLVLLSGLFGMLFRRL